MKASTSIAAVLLAAFALSACVAGIILPVPMTTSPSPQQTDENQKR